MSAQNNLFQFIQGIDSEKWTLMSPKERLDLLQRFEDIMAASTKRERVELKVMSEDFRKNNPNTMAYFDGSNYSICLNPKFLTSKISISGVSQFNIAKALETVAHEGRHAWQHYVVQHPREAIVDAKTRLALLMNFENYSSKGATYGAQMLELDARRFAREVLILIGEKIGQIKGEPDRIFQYAIRHSFSQEIAWAKALFSEYSYEQLCELEIKARKYSEKLHPGVDFSKISFFEDAKKVLKTRAVMEYIEGSSIRVKGEQFFEDSNRWTEFKPKTVTEKTDNIKVGKKNKLL